MAVKFEIISNYFCSFIISAATLHYCSAIAHWYDHCVMIAMFALMSCCIVAVQLEVNVVLISWRFSCLWWRWHKTQHKHGAKIPCPHSFDIRYYIGVLKIESFFRRSTMTWQVDEYSTACVWFISGCNIFQSVTKRIFIVVLELEWLHKKQNQASSFSRGPIVLISSKLSSDWHKLQWATDSVIPSLVLYA